MNYKDLIIDQVSEHFKKAKLLSVLFTYDLKNNSCNVKGLDLKKHEQIIQLSKKETTIIQSLIINKAKKIIKDDFIKLVINLDVEQKEFKTYIILNDLHQTLKKVELL
jgi:hypothetical protein